MSWEEEAAFWLIWPSTRTHSQDLHMHIRFYKWNPLRPFKVRIIHHFWMCENVCACIDNFCRENCFHFVHDKFRHYSFGWTRTNTKRKKKQQKPSIFLCPHSNGVNVSDFRSVLSLFAQKIYVFIPFILTHILSISIHGWLLLYIFSNQIKWLSIFLLLSFQWNMECFIFAKKKSK